MTAPIPQTHPPTALGSQRRRFSRAWFFGFLVVAAAVCRLWTTRSGFCAPQSALEWELRSLRACAAAAVGASLATAGAFLQTLLGNPLAAPSLLGLSSGAGLGVMLWVYGTGAGASALIAGGAGPAFAATAGALTALGVVYALSQRRGRLDPPTLLLLGVAVSLLCSAGMTVVQHLMPDRGLSLGARWLLGSLRDDTTLFQASVVLVASSVAVCTAWRFGPTLDAVLCGEDEARSLGAPLGRIRFCLFAASGCLTAGAFLLAGPIGFVGLLCPHGARMLTGPLHRSFLPSCALLGAASLLIADTLVRLIDLGAGRMPIGALTSVIGGPLFILALRRWPDALAGAAR